jgi:deoxyribose-phosphate aldolase
MKKLAGLIDHAVLQPESTLKDNEEGCRLALEYQVASICVKPCWVEFCSDFLFHSLVKVGTVIGFPHGSAVTEVKLREAECALRDGARELDVVVNFSKVLSGDWKGVRREIEVLTGLAHSAGSVVKFIFENCYLEECHKIMLCQICSDTGADFVKTSTGFGKGGATEDDIKLMVKSVSGNVRVKASGGIRDLQRFLLMRDLGAARIGTSSTARIIDEYRKTGEFSG